MKQIHTHKISLKPRGVQNYDGIVLNYEKVCCYGQEIENIESKSSSHNNNNNK